MLKISYEQFALLAPDGERFSAIPPFGVKGEVSNPMLIHAIQPDFNTGIYLSRISNSTVL